MQAMHRRKRRVGVQVELGPAAAQASDSLPSISSRRKKTQNQSPPSGNGRGPLQWGLTVTERPCVPHSTPSWTALPSLVNQRLIGAGEIIGETPCPHPRAHPGRRTSCLLQRSLRSCRAAPSPSSLLSGASSCITLLLPLILGFPLKPEAVQNLDCGGSLQPPAPSPSFPQNYFSREEKWQRGSWPERLG